MSDYECRWHLELVTPATELVLDVEEVRDDHLRAVSTGEEDAYISRLIKSVTKMAERVTRRALLTQSWALVLDRFPSHYLLIPKPPLDEVTAVTYVDVDGVTQTWTGSPLPYDVSTPVGPNAGRARLQPAYGEIFPTTRMQMDAVRVEFDCGYGDGEDVPEDIRHGMLLVIGEFYKHRSESVPTNTPGLIRAHDLWKPYRVP